MYQLNLGSAIQQVLDAKDLTISGYSIPDTVDAEKFQMFYRIMEAQSPDEIDDISIEDIISLWDNVQEFSSYFEEKRSLVSAIVCNLPNKKSIIKRRVL